MKFLFPQNWVPLLVYVRPVDTTKPEAGRRKDLFLATSKKNTAICPEALSI